MERNLYLTTQLTELGIPVVVAINMIDLVRKNGDKINVAELSRQLGCKVVEISALRGTGIAEAAEAAIDAAKNGKTVPMHTFAGPVEHALAHIEEAAVHGLPEEQQRWYAVKIFERDDKVLENLNIDPKVMEHINKDIEAVEKEMDDDSESIITNERYIYIGSIIKACYKKKNTGKLSTSDKIDKIVTNRWLGLPIFAAVMFLVYYISMVTVGSAATDWANDGLFGDGWHLFGIGSKAYNETAENYSNAMNAAGAFVDFDTEAEDFDADKVLAELEAYKPESENATATIGVEDEETLAVNEMTVYYSTIPKDAKEDETIGMTYVDAVKYLKENGFDEPDPAAYGVWVKGIPVLVGEGLEKQAQPIGLRALSTTVLLQVSVLFSALFRRCLFCSCCSLSLKAAVIWHVSHSSLTEFSANSVFPANPSFRCSSARAAAFPVLWHPERLKTNVTAA